MTSVAFEIERDLRLSSCCGDFHGFGRCPTTFPRLAIADLWKMAGYRVLNRTDVGPHPHAAVFTTRRVENGRYRAAGSETKPFSAAAYWRQRQKTQLCVLQSSNDPAPRQCASSFQMRLRLNLPVKWQKVRVKTAPLTREMSAGQRWNGIEVTDHVSSSAVRERARVRT